MAREARRFNRNTFLDGGLYIHNLYTEEMDCGFASNYVIRSSLGFACVPLIDCTHFSRRGSVLDRKL